MRTRFTRSLPLILPLLVLAIAAIACGGGKVDDWVARLNASATRAAGGIPGVPTVDLVSELFPTVDPNLTLTPQPTTEPTAIPASYSVDLTIDPNGLLANGWGRIYAQPSGTAFTLIATERQVGDYVIQTLKLSGLEVNVRGGMATIGMGQIRLDLALVGNDSAFGSGTITFQPTIDAFGRIKENPLGGEFGTLQLPASLYPSLGDAVHVALTGAANDSLSRVNVAIISLENGIMQVSGTVR